MDAHQAQHLGAPLGQIYYEEFDGDRRREPSDRVLHSISVETFSQRDAEQIGIQSINLLEVDCDPMTIPLTCDVSLETTLEVRPDFEVRVEQKSSRQVY
jgi:hypothetical protein